MGHTWGVKGSRQGLFRAIKSVPGDTLLIVEGPTDVAAALDLGYDVIGRPACVGCEDMIVRLVRKRGHVATFIVADADALGQRGAFDSSGAIARPVLAGLLAPPRADPSRGAYLTTLWRRRFQLVCA